MLNKIVKNPWNQNTYYYKKKHTKKHWKKETNKKTICEATTSVVATITTWCLPKHMEKLVVTFTCEGKPSFLWNIDTQETRFCTTGHFAQYSFTNHNSPFVPHALHISYKQTNKQTSTQNKCGNLNHDVIHYWGTFNYTYKDHAGEKIISITLKTKLTQYITTHTSQIMQAHQIFHK